MTLDPRLRIGLRLTAAGKTWQKRLDFSKSGPVEGMLTVF